MKRDNKKRLLKILFVINVLVIIFSIIGIINALPQDSGNSINFDYPNAFNTSITVNNSQFWAGYTPATYLTFITSNFASSIWNYNQTVYSKGQINSAVNGNTTNITTSSYVNTVVNGNYSAVQTNFSNYYTKAQDDANYSKITWNYNQTVMYPFVFNSTVIYNNTAGVFMGLGTNNPLELLTLNSPSAGNTNLLSLNYPSANGDGSNIIFKTGATAVGTIYQNRTAAGKYHLGINNWDGSTNAEIISVQGNNGAGTNKVGIGTQTPLALLSIEGGSVGQNVTFNGTGSAVGFIYDTTRGRLGVGVANPQSALHIIGTTNITGGANGGVVVDSSGDTIMGGTIGTKVTNAVLTTRGRISVGNGTGQSTFVNQKAQLQILTDSGNDDFLTFWQAGQAAASIGHPASNHYLAFYNEYYSPKNISEGFVLTRDGRVGVGLTAPAYSLEVNYPNKALNVSGFLYANSSDVGIGTNNPSRMVEMFRSTTTTVALQINNPLANANALTGIILKSNDSTGQLFTAPSNYTGATEWADRTNFVADVDSSGFSLVARKTDGDIKFYTGGLAIANKRVYIDSNGFVGINASAPLYRLEINSPIKALNVSGFLYVDNLKVGIGTNTPSHELNVVGSINTTNDMLIGDDLFIVDAVGIGTYTPVEKLDVRGNINASGTITPLGYNSRYGNAGVDDCLALLDGRMAVVENGIITVVGLGAC